MNIKTRDQLREIEEAIIEASTTTPKNYTLLPNKFEVNEVVRQIEKMIFPDFFGHDWSITDIWFRMHRQIKAAWCYDHQCDCDDEVIDQLTMDFLKQIPHVQELLWKDLDAFYEGDPAAHSKEDIIISYPGFHAVFVYRIAHILYTMQVPMLPRIMTEAVHSRTGIDINPGATIGEYFFMDHGTGIVIGETAVIGSHVKIYQGVTLGALSLQKGQLLANTKRHPTIEDRVTIYSNASILGGETLIGHDSVIGGNVFLTESVPPESRVTNKNVDMLVINRGEM